LVVRLHRSCSRFEAIACARNQTVDTMAEPWVAWYQDDLELYRIDKSWEENGIVPYVDAEGALIDEYLPWTCSACWKCKKFDCLDSSRDHISLESHCRSLERQREARERLALARGLDTSSALPPAALQGLPPSSSTRMESCSWFVSDSTIDGAPIPRASVQVDVYQETTGPPYASSAFRRASMTCRTLPAHFQETPDLLRSALPPQVSAAAAVGGLRTFPAFEAPPASSRSMASIVPAPASSGTPAPASSPKPSPRADGPAHHRTGSMEEGSSSSGGASSQAAWPGGGTPAADSRDRLSAAPAETRTCTVILYGVILNGKPIGGATLEVPISGPWAPPLDGSYVLDEVEITGVWRPTNGSTAHGSSSFPPLPQLRAGASGVDDASSSRLPVTRTGSVPAPTSGTFPGMMQVLFVAPTQPPRPLSPRPIDGAWQGDRSGGATTECANLWQGQSRCLSDEPGYSNRRLGG